MVKIVVLERDKDDVADNECIGVVECSRVPSRGEYIVLDNKHYLVDVVKHVNKEKIGSDAIVIVR